MASNHGGTQCLSGSSEWNTEWYPGNINPAQISSIFEEHPRKYLPNAGEMDGLMGGPPDERADRKYTLNEAYNLCYANDDCGGFHVHKNYFANWPDDPSDPHRWEYTRFISRNNINVMYDDSWDNNRGRGERYNSYVKKDAGGFGQISRPTGIPEGVDVNSEDDQGWSVLDQALASNNKECIDLIKSKGGKSNANKSIFIASGIGDLEAVKIHLESGVDVNLKDDSGWTALHYASDRKNVASLLIQKGAKLNAMNADDDTPLDKAIEWEDSETADLIRKHGGKTWEELNL